jgi:protein-disulfide isomerase
MNKPVVVPGKSLGTPAPVSSADHVLGPENAPVTIIEYSDFQCPACGIYYYVVEKLLASTTVPIKFVYRHFPLSQHQNAISASLASEAANVQGKFFEMYKLLFENQDKWSELENASLTFVGYAKDLGLDVERFKADMASSTLKAHINNDSDEGVRIGINSTPTFFVNGKAITNPQGYDEFKTIIEKSASGSTK